MQLLAGTLPSQLFSSQCIGEGSKMVEPLPNATDVGRRSRSATDWNPQGPHITAKAVMMTSWNDDDADAEHPQTCSLPDFSRCIQSALSQPVLVPYSLHGEPAGSDWHCMPLQQCLLGMLRSDLGNCYGRICCDFNGSEPMKAGHFVNAPMTDIWNYQSHSSFFLCKAFKV